MMIIDIQYFLLAFVQRIIIIASIMIRLIYRNEKIWRAHHACWSFLVFLVNSLAFWYIVLKCCFQQLCPRPPLPLTVICLLLILADRLYPPFVKRTITLMFWVDIIVWILLLLSLVLPDQNTVCFLGLAVTINLADAMYIKELMFDLVRRNYWVYKIYIIFKILYWIILYGHLIGCIFYAVQMYLLNNEYFGPFVQNPDLYYQGQLLAYTPIYMFQNLNRYVYAMYYSFALVSTIAFGDIIGKNYIEDIYVMMLIILSTIVISLIIEQMYIIFRRRKTRFFELLNQVRFLSERLKGYKQIPNYFRQQIINYLIEANWRYMTEYPLELDSSKEFKTKIIKQSIIANPDLPQFYSKYLLHKLKFTHLPKGVLVSSNVPQRQQLVSYMVTQGKYWVGYSTYSGRLAGGYVVDKEGINFGIEEALVGTNDLYRMLSIRTVSPGVILTISRRQIDEIMVELSQTQFPCDKPIQHYQLARDKAVFKRNKYQCNLCNTSQHTLINCPKCHYVIDNQRLLEIANCSNQRQYKARKTLRSSKVRGIHLQAFQHVEERSYKLIQLQRFRDIFNRIRSIRETEEKVIEKWYKWTIYGKDIDEEWDNKEFALNSEHYHFIDQILTVQSPKKMPQNMKQY